MTKSGLQHVNTVFILNHYDVLKSITMRQYFDNIPYYNRETRMLEYEDVYAKKYKHFFYSTKLGRLTTRLIMMRKFFSRIYALYYKNALSKKKISKFIEHYKISLDGMEKPLQEFQNFNDFFIRKLKSGSRKIDRTPGVLISPADSRLVCKTIENNQYIHVKGQKILIHDLMGDRKSLRPYHKGLCMIFRLAPYDYHRFCYIDNGSHGPIVSLPGHYHPSGPIEIINRYFPMFQSNYREYCVMKTEHFDSMIHIDVGAMTIGKIIQHNRHQKVFKKGEEKGYFEYGASTIILLFKPGVVELDEDIQFYSKKNIETQVKYGLRIGKTIQ